MTRKPPFSKMNLNPDNLIELDNLLQAYIDRGELPGFVTLIAQGSEVRYFKARGLKDIEQGTPYCKDTIVRVFSMTKPIASVALLQLWEQGLFKLEDPISGVLPQFSRMQVYENGSLVPATQPISFLHLLTHTAGLSYGSLGGIELEHVDQMYDKADLFNKEKSLSDMIDALVKLPLRYQPGQHWHYSMATDVVGRIVEVLSGLSFAAYVERHIFQPLKMVDTHFEIQHNKTTRLATLYRRSEESLLSELDKPADSSWLAPIKAHRGGSGLLSTATDYFRFCRCLLQDGELDGQRLLKPETVKMMTKNHVDEKLLPIKFEFSPPFHGLGFGLGVAVTVDENELRVAGSNGDYGWGGYAETVFWIDPKHDLICVNLTQCIPSGAYSVRKQLRDAVYGALEL